MSGLEASWSELPVLREFFQQWRRIRVEADAREFQKPFSREWESLLEDAGIVSAEDRRAADRDVRVLARAGLLELRTHKYRSYEIERVLLPNEAEPRLRELFAAEMPAARAAVDLSGLRWEPELAFVPGTATAVNAEDLLKLNEFFASGGRARPVVPVKERSLEIFGDEKRLDALLSTSLFRLDRLTAASLRCEIAAEPRGWRRGPSAQGPVLVLENLATWHSYARWNDGRALFGAVVYGGGNRFMEGAAFLGEIFREIGGLRRTFYFGDLDPQGLRIPFRASARAAACGLPRVEPDLWSYRRLLDAGAASDGGETAAAGEEELAWLGPLGGAARELFGRRKRLPQERIGWEFLHAQEKWEPEPSAES
jgi:hypothetical protein